MKMLLTNNSKEIRRKERKTMIYTDTCLNDAPLWWVIDFLEYTSKEYHEMDYIVADGRLKIVVQP